MVVPSNRPRHVREFLAAWSPYPWDETIVVCDDAQPFDLYPCRYDLALSWADLPSFGADAHVFSRRDSAVRCLGFVTAVGGGADVVLTLDDDCYPAGEPAAFLARHVENLYYTNPWCSSCPGLVPRGMPYSTGDQVTHRGRCDIGVAVSMGLWHGHADIDAVHTLADGHQATNYEPPCGVRVMHPAQFFPFCGMNFAFKAQALPALYFPPMGEGSPFSRFDDIWAGLVLQRALAAVDMLVTTGEPFVNHARASDPFKNLIREAPGVEANEWAWRLLGRPLPPQEVLPDAVAVLAERLRRGARELAPRHLAGYFERWADNLAAWLRVCQAAFRSRSTLLGRLGEARAELGAPDLDLVGGLNAEADLAAPNVGDRDDDLGAAVR